MSFSMWMYNIVLPKTEIGELYLNRTIRTFAWGLIYSFVPIYLLNNGYTFPEIFAYFIFTYIFLSLFSYLAIKLSSKIGVKHAILLNVPVFALMMFSLYAINFIQIPVYVISLLYALETVLYWIPCNCFFITSTSDKTRGRAEGFLGFLANISATVAPLIGSWVIMQFGFPTLFILVSIILCISVFPLFLSKDVRLHNHYQWGTIFSSKNILYAKEIFAQGVLMVASVIWPLFIYTLHPDYLFVGLASTLSGVGIGIFTFFVGILSDKHLKSVLIQIGGLLSAVLWLFAVFAESEADIYLISIFMGFFMVMINLPVYIYTCRAAKMQGTAEFMVFREIMLSLGRGLPLIVVLFFPLALQFDIIFGMAVAASLYFMIPKRVKC